MKGTVFNNEFSQEAILKKNPLLVSDIIEEEDEESLDFKIMDNF